MSLRSWLRAHLARRLRLPEIPVSLERLARLGFAPKRVFDVGAYRGEFARLALRLWPDAEIACFEVLPSGLDELKELAREHGNVSIVPVLVGAEPRDAVPFHQAETASSILKEHANDLPAASFPMTTVDHAVRERFRGRAPDLLKLDVQGYELEVLKGATEALGSAQVVLAEVNLLDLHVGVPLLADVVAWLDGKGWAAYDVCGLTRRPLDQALWQVDMLFVPRGSPLRADKRWNDRR